MQPSWIQSLYVLQRMSTCIVETTDVHKHLKYFNEISYGAILVCVLQKFVLYSTVGLSLEALMSTLFLRALIVNLVLLLLICLYYCK